VLTDVEGMNWGAFKPLLADALIAHLEPIQKRYQDIMKVSTKLGRGVADNTSQLCCRCAGRGMLNLGFCYVHQQSDRHKVHC
jgi:hypothetical protein